MLIEATAIRAGLALLRRFWPFVVVAAALLACWLMAQRMQGLEASIIAQQATIDAKSLQIKVQAASIEQARLLGEQRAAEVQAAVAAAAKEGAARQREIDRLRGAKPSTGNDCKDAEALIRDYRARMRAGS